MPCNAIATIRTKLALPQSLQAAAKELTKEQAIRLYSNLLAELGNEQPNISNYYNSQLIKITANGITISIKHNSKGVYSLDIEPSVYDDRTRNLPNIIARFTEQTVKAAGLIKQAKAINAIKARYLGVTTTNAPNGATIINLDI